MKRKPLESACFSIIRMFVFNEHALWKQLQKLTKFIKNNKKI